MHLAGHPSLNSRAMCELSALLSKCDERQITGHVERVDRYGRVTIAAQQRCFAGQLMGRLSLGAVVKMHSSMRIPADIAAVPRHGGSWEQRRVVRWAPAEQCAWFVVEA